MPSVPLSCLQVVSGKSWVCFSESDIVGHKATLLDPASSKHLLLNTLRKVRPPPQDTPQPVLAVRVRVVCTAL